MKLSELISRFNLTASEIAEIQLSPEQVIVHREFERKISPLDKKDNYRDRAVRSMVKNRASFRSESNIFGEVTDLVLTFRCPVCNSDIGAKYTGGAGGSSSVMGRCKPCKVEVSLSVNSDGIGVNFDE